MQAVIIVTTSFKMLIKLNIITCIGKVIQVYKVFIGKFMRENNSLNIQEVKV
jgi:hypothetical protein